MARSEYVQGDGARLHVLTEGEGPLVLMVHGFPGLAYSWRHQMHPLAEAGYRAVAVDCRGYGRSDRPSAVDVYDAETYRRDLTAILDHFDAGKAVLIGQDFGAQHVWNMAVRSPDRVAAVVGMVPYDMDLAGRALAGSGPGDGDPAAMASAATPPSARFAAMAERHFVHVHYFQSFGPPERELAGRPLLFLQRLFWALSGQGNLLNWANFPSAGTGYLDVLPEAPPLPWDWLSAADLDHYVAEYMAGEPSLTFIGGLNSYRSADINWRIGERWADANVTVPAYFLCGAEDPVLKLIDPDWRAKMAVRVPDLRRVALIPEAGHFVQQERPRETNAALLSFLADLKAK